jgi:hypothetical protein
MRREKFIESDLITGAGVEGKRKKKPEKEESTEPQAQQDAGKEVSVPRDEKKRGKTKLTFKAESDANIFDTTRK